MKEKIIAAVMIFAMYAVLALVLIVPVAFTVGCAGQQGGGKAKMLDGLNIARDSYNQAQQIAQSLRDAGIITHEVWNSKVVPVDNAAHAAIDHAYELLKIYVATGDSKDYNEYALALTEVFKLISDFRSLANGFANTGAHGTASLPPELPSAYIHATATGGN